MIYKTLSFQDIAARNRIFNEIGVLSHISPSTAFQGATIKNIELQQAISPAKLPSIPSNPDISSIISAQPLPSSTPESIKSFPWKPILIGFAVVVVTIIIVNEVDKYQMKKKAEAFKRGM